MAIEVEERLGSRRMAGENSFEFLYWAKTDAGEDESAVRAAIAGVVPPDYETFPIRGMTEFEDQGAGLFFATVLYAAQDPDPIGADATQWVEFDTTGGTQHITQSKETIDSFTWGVGHTTESPAPDLGGAIGVDESLDIQGVDIPAQSFEFTVHLRKPLTEVDSDFILALYDLKAHTNNASVTITFFDDGSGGDVQITFDEGELLFMGGTGGLSTSTAAEFVLHFSASPNKTGITVGDLTGIDKKGWEYLWVRYQRQTHEASGEPARLIIKPQDVYIERVFDPGDFSRFGIV